MNKHTAITIIAVIIIVIPFIYSGLNIIGVQQLEYRWHGPEEFRFFTMSNHGEIEFCNTIPFWMSFEGLEIGTFLEEKHLGTFSTNPITINPLSSTTQEGIFISEEIAASQHIFMTIDFEFDGGDIRLNPNQFIVGIRAQVPILGIIPYSTTTQMTGWDFDQMMNSEGLFCN